MKINLKKINIKKIFKSELLEFIKSRKFAIIIIACLLVLFFCLFIFSYHLQVPLSKNIEEKIFVIEKGKGSEKIAANLRKEGFITNKWAFFYYIWLKNKSAKLQAGAYSLSPSMSALEIAKKIIKGDVIKDWIKITIPEGWTNQRIEARLIESGILIPKEYEFYRVATEDFPFLADRPLGPSLQGYLFPDTYYFDKETFIGDAVKKMLSNFGRKLTKDLEKEIKKQGKTIHDIVIMASILEREVITDEDRAIVSGIFWKRIKNNYPLQSCATIAYVLEKDKWRYSYKDTRIESPYNTYLNIGLPPTPINNPGLSTIKAAIYPQETEYNFFLTDPETNKTIFSKTLDEHNQNKAKYF